MPLKRSTRNISGSILVSTAITKGLYNRIMQKAGGDMTISDMYRGSITKWIDNGAPVMTVQDERFKYHIGAYLDEGLYNRLNDVSKRRKLSMAQCIRMAITYCYGE